MDTISIRYGQTVTLPIDTGDADAETATIYIGKPGEVYVLSKTATLTDGSGVFELDSTDTELPLDTYNYQINVISGDQISKYPSPDNDCFECESKLPKFIVNEALDQTEVS